MTLVDVLEFKSENLVMGYIGELRRGEVTKVILSFLVCTTGDIYIYIFSNKE